MNGASVWQAELGGMWVMAPEWVLSGAYMYMKGNQVVDNNHAHQLTGTLKYFLSKRTSVYVAAVYQRTNQRGERTDQRRDGRVERSVAVHRSRRLADEVLNDIWTPSMLIATSTRG
ncbi:porin [Paraburkholderia sp. EG304]|uniref:porin n=1 Tax=Paraburkholderia sp. EG304 TaxID=3237015 RepID=UPI00397C6A7D